MVTNNPLPPTPSPLRSEGEEKQRKSGENEQNSFPSTRSGEEMPDNVVYTRTTLDIWNKIKPFARQMRHDSTAAEDTLWQQLRRKSIGHYKFRRQHPIDRFIVDFFCKERRLVIEVDGAIHDYTPEEDALRSEFLESRGLRVIRFTMTKFCISLRVFYNIYVRF